MYTAYGVGFRPDGTIGALTPKSQFGGGKMDYAKAVAGGITAAQGALVAVGKERIERDFMLFGGMEAGRGGLGGIKAGDKSMRAMRKGMNAAGVQQAQYGAAPQGCSQDSYRYQNQWRSFPGHPGASYGADPCGGCGKNERCVCNVNNVCKCETNREFDLAQPTVSIIPRQTAARMRQPVQSTTVARLMRRR